MRITLAPGRAVQADDPEGGVHGPTVLLGSVFVSVALKRHDEACWSKNRRVHIIALK